MFRATISMQFVLDRVLQCSIYELMSSVASTARFLSDPPPGGFRAMRDRQMAELARMRAAGMATIERIGRWSDGLLSPAEVKELAGRRGIINEYVRVARGVRQIIVLEQETMGWRAAPLRDVDAPGDIEDGAEDGAEDGDDDGALEEADDLEALERDYGATRERFGSDDDLDDYDTGPLDQVIARVREDLNIEPPEDDPFAPPPGRRPVDNRRDSGSGGAKASEPGAANDRAASGAEQASRGEARGGSDFLPVEREDADGAALATAADATARSRGPPG
jgi:hypothetical protein